MEPAISQRVLIGIVTGGRIKRNAVARFGIDIDNLSFVAIHTQYRVVVGIVDRFDGSVHAGRKIILELITPARATETVQTVINKNEISRCVTFHTSRH